MGVVNFLFTKMSDAATQFVYLCSVVNMDTLHVNMNKYTFWVGKIEPGSPLV